MTKPPLILFDIDGTISEFHSGIVYPKVKEWFDSNSRRYEIAFVTNQGGVALGYATEQQIQDKIKFVTNQLPKGLHPFYPTWVCYYYPQAPYNQSSGLNWNPQWRKPQPGMLLTAMEVLGYNRATMVGDLVTDKQAANFANCEFIYAKEFFR